MNYLRMTQVSANDPLPLHLGAKVEPVKEQAKEEEPVQVKPGIISLHGRLQTQYSQCGMSFVTHSDKQGMRAAPTKEQEQPKEPPWVYGTPSEEGVYQICFPWETCSVFYSRWFKEKWCNTTLCPHDAAAQTEESCWNKQISRYRKLVGRIYAELDCDLGWNSGWIFCAQTQPPMRSKVFEVKIRCKDGADPNHSFPIYARWECLKWMEVASQINIAEKRSGQESHYDIVAWRPVQE